MRRTQSLIELARARQQREESEVTDSDTSSSSSCRGAIGKRQDANLNGIVGIRTDLLPRESGATGVVAGPRGTDPGNGASQLTGIKDEWLFQGGRNDDVGDIAEGWMSASSPNRVAK